MLRQNRYDAGTDTLTLTAAEAESFQSQQAKWADYFSKPTTSAGLPAKYITDPGEIRQLTAFFAWTAWASSAERPGKKYSYTNNFPYDPAAGNLPSSDAFLWSALSLVGLLGGTALVLVRLRKIQLPRLEERGPARPSQLDARDHHGQPEGDDQVLPRRQPSLPRAGSRGRGDGPLPRRPGELLRDRHLDPVSRATSCGPGISSWRSSGSPRRTSRAACSWRRRSAGRIRPGSRSASTSCSSRS